MAKKNKKNKKLIFIIVISIFLFLVIGITLYLFISKRSVKDMLLYKKSLTIEVGEDIPSISDYLYKTIEDKAEIEWSNIDIKDNKIYKVGTYYGTFMYKDKKKKVTLIVEDTIAPAIEGTSDIEVLAYEKVPNFLENISVIDNSMETIEVSLTGEYDIEKAGEYTLYYTASDSSGNETKESFKLIVKENKNVVVSKSSRGYTIKNAYGITYLDNNIIVNKTYGLPSNYVPSNLVTINGYIRVVDYVKEAFNELKSDSASLGLNIYASSGYRSYGDQDYIYNNYVKMDGKERADTYSARAGYSEHQTGLAIDVNTIDMTFDNTSESEWLKHHAYEYGFIIRYPKGKDNITGYMYEPWHIRYIGKDLAKVLYNNGDWITLEEYYGINSKYSN